MSVVPYNQNNQIVFNDPSLGIVVVHDLQKNELQLVSLNPDLSASDTARRPSNGSIHEHMGHMPMKCLNCGFSWNSNSTGRKYLQQHSPEYGHALLDTTSLASNLSHSNNGIVSKEILSGPLLLSKSPLVYIPSLMSSGGHLDKNFMHHDYFKLLGSLMVNSKHLQDVSKSPFGIDTSSSNLPDSIFNQGYFKRFFKKVPPFILGSGAHAQVYKVVHVLNDIMLGTYAVKRICMGDEIELLPRVLKEVMILYELSMQGANENNLIRYNHVWLEMGDLGDLNTFILPLEANKNGNRKVPYVFILQQYCAGGHLEDIIYDNFMKDAKLTSKEKVERERQQRRNRRNSLKNAAPSSKESKTGREWLLDGEIWKFFNDVTRGVHYLHCHGILHRDLKPSNCLLDKKYHPENIGESDPGLFLSELPRVLVTDFGEGKFINKHKKFEVLEEAEGTSINLFTQKEEEGRRGNTGTLEFTAPELWLYSNYDPELADSEWGGSLINDFTYESDIYSLGLILCWLCVGTLPFTDDICGLNDPLQVREIIIKWYINVTESSFKNWFESKRKGKNTLTMQQFQTLIFLMLKGVESEKDPQQTKRILTDEVLEHLERISWNFHQEAMTPSHEVSILKSFLLEVIEKYYKYFSMCVYCLCYVLLEYSTYLAAESFWVTSILKLVAIISLMYEISTHENGMRLLNLCWCVGVLAVSIGALIQNGNTK